MTTATYQIGDRFVSRATSLTWTIVSFDAILGLYGVTFRPDGDVYLWSEAVLGEMERLEK